MDLFLKVNINDRETVSVAYLHNSNNCQRVSYTRAPGMDKKRTLKQESIQERV